MIPSLSIFDLVIQDGLLFLAYVLPHCSWKLQKYLPRIYPGVHSLLRICGDSYEVKLSDVSQLDRVCSDDDISCK